jgi:hypothetical protein
MKKLQINQMYSDNSDNNQINTSDENRKSNEFSQQSFSN